MKVVKRVIDGKLVYRSLPDFDIGLGMRNATLLFGGNESYYVEIEITEEEWNLAIDTGNVVEK